MRQKAVTEPAVFGRADCMTRLWSAAHREPTGRPCGGSVVSAKGTRALCDTKREGSALVEGGKDHRGVPVPAPAPCRRSGLVRPDMARGNRGAQWTPSPSLALSPLSPVSACRPLSSRWKSRTGRAGSRLQEELAEPLFPFRRSSQRHPRTHPAQAGACAADVRVGDGLLLSRHVARRSPGVAGFLRSTPWG
jgi:hypothetical protein